MFEVNTDSDTLTAVDVFDELEDSLRHQVMEDLFGQTGNNMGFMRHTIGSSDLSYNQYSYDDNGPSFNLGEPDPTLSHFVSSAGASQHTAGEHG